MEIVTLAGRFTSFEELQAYCDAQFVSLRETMEKLKAQEEEIAHLKSLLVHTAPLESKVEVVKVSDERTICEIQLNLLLKSSMDRELTLEEAKKFDIFSKHLTAIKSQNPSMLAEFSNLQLQDSKLLELASSPDGEHV